MTDILDLLPNARRAAQTNGGEYASPCPWCGGQDRFRTWPTPPSGNPRWWCRRCERKGDHIALLRELKGMSFREAASATGNGNATGSRTSRRPRPPLRPPNVTWQSRAEEIAQAAEMALWSPCGSHALDYLRNRGFADETIRTVRLGYIADEFHDPPEAWGLPAGHTDVWVPSGIAIPWRGRGDIWRLNVRRDNAEPKYCGPAGYCQGLFGVDGLNRGLPVVMCEGEFDALSVAQEAGDLVSAVATGSTGGARGQRWLRLLSSAPSVLVAFDGDTPGDEAAEWWINEVPKATRLAPKVDASAMLEAGRDLRDWIVEAVR
jgi:DNA primase